jgi:acyl dehydratase
MNQTVIGRPEMLPVPPEWFEDYCIGWTITSPTRVVTDDDVRAYVRFSNDVRPLLGQTEPGGLRVPNMYLFSLGVSLLLHGGRGYISSQFVAFFGFDSITFHSQAQGSDALRSTATVRDVIPRNTTGLVVYQHETSLVSGELLVSSVQRILVRRKVPNGRPANA